MRILIFLLSGLFILFGCANEPAASQEKVSGSFQEYWYQGKAELNSYNLTQARYGEERQGKAVLIYVTEDFSKSDHHKINDPVARAEDVVPILKLNMTREFVTGIYPYKLMQSSFSPVNPKQGTHALRVTSGIQEWCGQAFSQIDRFGEELKVQQFSYFESEGDLQKTLSAEWMEDDFWTLIRVAPEKLPEGEVTVLPGMAYSQLKHKKWKNERARCSKTEKKGVVTFSVEYLDMERQISWEFDKKFPHKLLAWEETYSSGWGANKKVMTSRGELDQQMMLDYWNRNGSDDVKLRGELGLD